jgi:hypothetical protein
MKRKQYEKQNEQNYAPERVVKGWSLVVQVDGLCEKHNE